MRIAFFLLLVVHGLVHLTGFVKAFGLAGVPALTQNISKPLGVFWLLAFVILGMAASALAFKNEYWWIFGLTGVVISQTLIFFFWHDARFGTIANAFILVAIIIQYAGSAYYQRYQNEVKLSLQQTAYFRNGKLTEADLKSLPDLVRKYLRFTGAVGKPKVNNFKVKFIGKIRKNEESDWMPFTSEQYNIMQTPTRLFFMKAKMKGLPIAAYHSFKNGNAFMDIRLFSLVRVQYQKGAAMGISETVTFFNDMCCLAPATLIDKRINWLKTDERSVKASFTNNNITIDARLYFNEEGALINFVSEDRYSADAGKQIPWATPLKDYQQIEGYKLMKNAETIYSFPDRNLCYGKFQLTQIKYNCL